MQSISSLLMRIVVLCFIILVHISCTRQVEELNGDTASEYMPLQVGKYRTYRLDSTVFTNFGSTTETHSYQEKHVVDAAITDAAGKPAFRILRYIRSVNATTEPWKTSGYYTITVDDNIEVSENNLRVIKLISPVKNELSWKGNSYLGNEPYSPAYKYDLIRDFGDWIYEYVGTNESVTLLGKNYDSVITVLGVDESFNVPISTPQQIGYKKLSIDKYAKNIGLIYQELALWEYQPNTRYTGFAVKRTLIDYN